MCKTDVFICGWVWAYMSMSMMTRYTLAVVLSVCLSVCMSVCLLSCILIVIICKDEVRYHRGLENTLFKSYYVISLPLLPTSLPDSLSTTV